MNYPVTITERPHRGNPRTWLLHDEDHLGRCIDEANAMSNYYEYQMQRGRLICTTRDDGDVDVVDKGAYTLDAYIDWLGHDLRSLDVTDDVTELVLEAYGNIEGENEDGDILYRYNYVNYVVSDGEISAISHDFLSAKGDFEKSVSVGNIQLYTYKSFEFVVLYENDVITRKEDNKFGPDGAYFPYKKEEK